MQSAGNIYMYKMYLIRTLDLFSIVLVKRSSIGSSKSST